MARLHLHGRRLPGLRPRRPIPEPRHWYRRWSVHFTHRGLCVGCLGDDQAEGRARASRLCSVRQLWRIDTLSRNPLHELRRHVVGCQRSVGFGQQDPSSRHLARHVAGTL